MSEFWIDLLLNSSNLRYYVCFWINPPSPLCADVLHVWSLSETTCLFPVRLTEATVLLTLPDWSGVARAMCSFTEFHSAMEGRDKINPRKSASEHVRYLIVLDLNNIATNTKAFMTKIN